MAVRIIQVSKLVYTVQKHLDRNAHEVTGLDIVDENSKK